VGNRGSKTFLFPRVRWRRVQGLAGCLSLAVGVLEVRVVREALDEASRRACHQSPRPTTEVLTCLVICCVPPATFANQLIQRASAVNRRVSIADHESVSQQQGHLQILPSSHGYQRFN
jgi:hypothetical protein